MNYQLIIVIVFLVILYINKKNLTNIYIRRIKKYHSPYKIVLLIVFMHLITFSQSIFSIIASFIFGFKLGYIYSIISVLLSSNITFFISRYLLKNNIKKILTKYEFPNKILKSQKHFTNIEWYKLSFLSRFSFIPFGITNLLWGITEIDYYKYLLTTLFGSIIFIFFECYIGHNIKYLTEIKSKNIYIIIFSIIFVIFILYYIDHILSEIFKRDIDKDKDKDIDKDKDKI